MKSRIGVGFITRIDWVNCRCGPSMAGVGRLFSCPEIKEFEVIPLMQSMQQPRGVADWIDSHVAGHALARPFYTDPAFFEAELEAIWFRQWIFVGMSCEIAAPASWFTVDIANASVIVSRDSDGNLHAFHNTCRHRGSRICLEERGQSKSFVCPYHQWRYDGNGDLSFAREMGPGFDKTRHSLHPVQVREVAGYLFISLAADPPPFDEFADAITPYLAPHDLANAKIAFESTLIDKTNWKLLIENNRECYHCAGGHPELTRTIADVEDTSDPRCSPAYRERALRDEARWKVQGLPHRFQRSEQGWQIVRVPSFKG
ncbi:MAG: aromatic ring-hydroxylating dioxygenase subunit alpha, partial [Burkholderiales bacterium]|nr:aromatic ring-hydroxylating dioxygenase subunit alpha [Burkholderiales bacterium]